MFIDNYLNHLQELSRAERRYRTIKKLELRRYRDKLKIKLAALKRSKASKSKAGAAKRAKDKLSKLQMYKRSSAAKRVKGTRLYPIAKR